MTLTPAGFEPRTSGTRGERPSHLTTGSTLNGRVYTAINERFAHFFFSKNFRAASYEEARLLDFVGYGSVRVIETKKYEICEGKKEEKKIVP